MSIVNTKKITNVDLTEEDMITYKQLTSQRMDFWRLYPRMQYDMTIVELLIGYFYTFIYSPDEHSTNVRIGKAWNPTKPECVVTTLSVRTFFDALLTVLKLPEGSEVLMSSLTIPNMADILKHHKVVPIAFDVDLINFRPNLEQCKSLISPKTKMMLVAPLFGRPMKDCDKISQLAKENNIMFILDGAQSFSIRDSVEKIPYDIMMVSFGSIKFSTALGGAISTVKDPVLADKIRDQVKTYTPRPKFTHMKNMLKYGFTVGTDDPISFGMMRNMFELFGLHFGEFVNKISRGFVGPDLFKLIRFRPPPPMLSLLHYRITHISDQRRLHHCQAAWDILSRLPNYIQVVSAGDPEKPEESTFWLFALYCREPQMCYDIFQAYGFDAALGTSQMRAMGTDVDCPNSTGLMKHILYFPMYAAIGGPKRSQLVQLFKDIPRKLIETPHEQFHQHVATTKFKHAYRSPAVAKLLKGHAPFKELPPGLLSFLMSPVLSAYLATSML